VLASGQALTHLEIFERLDPPVMNIRGRISELRKDGYRIPCERVGGREVYRLLLKQSLFEEAA